jgi:hypothetical protein
MRGKNRIAISFFLAASMACTSCASTFAELSSLVPPEAITGTTMTLEQTRALLQKGLTLHEIDQEIARLAAEEPAIAAKIEEARRESVIQGERLDAARNRAGRVVRAYYMGQRKPLWSLVLTAKSFSQALAIFEFVSQIVQSDQRALGSYREAKQRWEQSEKRWGEVQAELSSLRTKLLEQREKLLVLQQELDQELSEAPDASAIKEQLLALTSSWEQQGLPLFKAYFQALSESFNQMPELLTKQNNLTVQGFDYTFRIDDVDLNDFLRGKNAMFNQFTFEFQDGQVIASGQDGDIHVLIKGRYKLENQPNAIRFHIDELVYNGLLLPETTAKALESDYQLAIYPQRFASFFVATGVDVNDGSMAVTLKLDIFQKLQ